MNIGSIIAAIKTTFQATSGLTSLGTLYYGTVVDGTNIPYAEFHLYDDVPFIGFRPTLGDHYFVQFNVFDISLTNVAAYLDVIEGAFHRVKLTLNDGLNISSLRVRSLPSKSPVKKDKNGNDVFFGMVEFKFTVQQD